jgi:pyruvate dehydrogenase E1 component beta subunit
LDAPIRRLTQTDTPFAFATTLIDAALPQIADVVRTAKEVCYKS